MSPELETYYNNFNSLFNHDGFKQLLEELSNSAIQLADIQSIKDEQDLYYRKGQLAALATILNLETTVTASREQIEKEAEGFIDV